MKRPLGHGQSNSLSNNDAQGVEIKVGTENGDQETTHRVGSLRVPKTSYNTGEEGNKTSRSHLRTVSAYAGPQPRAEEKAPPLPTQAGKEKRYHPTARAKSLGHARRDFSYNDSNAAPPLPSDLNNDAFFDDITMDEYNADQAVSNKVTLVPTSSAPLNNAFGNDMTEAKIMEQAARAHPGSMPSIEHPRSLFLKGLFSVQTTSTKPLPVIRANIISVLSKLGVQFTEVRGGFICVHTPSIGGAVSVTNSTAPTIIVNSVGDKREEGAAERTSLKSQKSSGEDSLDHAKIGEHKADNSSVGDSDQLSTPSSNSKGHRRKFSVGGSILGYRRKASIGGPIIPETPVASSNYHQSGSPSTHLHGHGEFDSTASLDSLGGGHGGSDMLISSRIEQTKNRATSATFNNSCSLNENEPAQQSPQPVSVVQSRTPLKFEIHIVKVPLVGLSGVHFKKVTGNTWMYKALAGQILNELNL